jgi:hypothetical protein
MCIWCIKIGIVLLLHFNPWVEASVGGLLVPEGPYSPVAMYFGTWLEIRKWMKLKNNLSFMNSFQNEKLSLLCIALSFNGFGSISWHNICFFRLLYSVHNFIFRISNFFGLSTTEETWVVEMCIWCIKIGIVIVLHFNPWVKASAGGLWVPEAKYFGAWLKIRKWINLIKQFKFYKFI